MRDQVVTFDDVAVYFSAEEWATLEKWQKELYKDVTLDQYQTLLSVGLMKVIPEIILRITMGEEPVVNHKRATCVTAPETPAPEMSPARPQGNGSARPQGNGSARPQGNGSARPQGNASARPQGNASSRPQGNASTRPALEDSHNIISNTKMNFNVPAEIYPISTKQKEEATHKKGAVQNSILENCRDPDAEVQNSILKNCRDPDAEVQNSILKNCRDPDAEVQNSILENCRDPDAEVQNSILENCRDPDADMLAATEKPTRGEKRYVCVDCGKTFTFWSSLVRHTTADSCVAPHLCSDYGASFNYRSQLLFHQKTHIGSKHHECSTCGKRFVRKSSLDVHIRSHTGEKPFICSLCNKSFNEAGNLRRHVRIHTGERPFRCNTCGKCFNDSSVLIRHGKWYCPLKKGKSRKPPRVREEPRSSALNAEAQSGPPITCVEGGQVCSRLLTPEAEVMESGQGDPQVVGEATVPPMEELNSDGTTYQEIINKDMNPLDIRDECDNEFHPTAERGGSSTHVKGTVNMCTSYLMLIVPPAQSRDIGPLNARTMCQENMVEDMDNRVNCKSDHHQNTPTFGLKNKRDEYILLNSLCNPLEGLPATNTSLEVHKSKADGQLYSLGVEQEREVEPLESIQLSAPPSGIKCAVDERELTQQTTWFTQDVLKTKEDISGFPETANQEVPRIICATEVYDGEAFSQHSQAKNQEPLGNQKTGTKKRGKQGTCSKCGESFTYDCRRLIPHRCQEKLFQCDCGESFKQGFQLERHQKTHSGHRSYKCQKCRKAFKCEANLLQHLRSHTEVRPYPCTECGKAFKEAGKLRRHLRIHTGEKPFRCAECGKRFNDPSSLNRHVKIHMAKASQCSQCRRCFRDAHGLHKHMKTHRSR